MSTSNSEASSSRASSASLEDDIIVPPTVSKKAGKAKANQPGPRNEGTDHSWAFKPPPGSVLVDDLGDAGDFDWDSLNANDDLELCLIRVPDAVRFLAQLCHIRQEVDKLCRSKPNTFKA
jgi:hypothetical protein